jgi:hypothetical protein
LDPDRRGCVIDAGTPVGRGFNRLFVGFVRRKVSEDSYRVDRVMTDRNHAPEEAHA